MAVKPGIGLGERRKDKKNVKLIVHSPVGRLIYSIKIYVFVVVFWSDVTSMSTDIK